MDNPQAFPRSSKYDSDGEYAVGHNGMTLRDYFASAYLSSFEVDCDGAEEQIAINCYKIADAMLKERSK